MTSTTPPPQTVQPTIAAISPTNVPAGSGNFILTIMGTGLGMTSQVKFGRAVLMPSSATPTNCPAGGFCVALAVNVPTQDVASATTITVSVANASLASNAVAFAVTPQSGSVTGAPQLLLVSPMVAPAGGASFELVVEAQNVAQGRRGELWFTLAFTHIVRGDVLSLIGCPLDARGSSACICADGIGSGFSLGNEPGIVRRHIESREFFHRQ
jgi:hypothetical protein